MNVNCEYKGRIPLIEATELVSVSKSEISQEN